jgi:hypothetical protein
VCVYIYIYIHSPESFSNDSNSYTSIFTPYTPYMELYDKKFSRTKIKGEGVIKVLGVMITRVN